jgi:hypothetical protein
VCLFKQVCSNRLLVRFLCDSSDENKSGVPLRTVPMPNGYLLNGGFDAFRGIILRTGHRRFAEAATHKEANEKQSNEKKGDLADPITGPI